MADLRDFNLAFELLIDVEGGYSTDPNDSGNWTGGACGVGECKGTKYGVSAAAYPELDIAGLTLPGAKAIYRADYWGPAGCPDMSGRLAFIVFDAAVNNGVARAVGWLQQALGVPDDGVYGPATQEALGNVEETDPSDMALAQEVHALRINFMAGLDTWGTYGLGWSRRLALIPLEATLYWPTPPAPPKDG